MLTYFFFKSFCWRVFAENNKWKNKKQNKWLKILVYISWASVTLTFLHFTLIFIKSLFYPTAAVRKRLSSQSSIYEIFSFSANIPSLCRCLYVNHVLYTSLAIVDNFSIKYRGARHNDNTSKSFLPSIPAFTLLMSFNLSRFKIEQLEYYGLILVLKCM